MFSVKASSFATNRKLLAEGRESIDRFIGSGISDLGAKVGPIVWQFMPTKRFEPEDFEGFLNLLPKQIDGLALRHVMDVRHPSFMTPAYLALARRFGCVTVFADTDEHPSFADLTGDLVYARLMRCQSALASGYAPEALDAWAERVRVWASGAEPADLARVEHTLAAGKVRDVFVFFISGAKERAPAAAVGLLKRLA